MIARLRVWSKRVLPRLPVIGPSAAALFARRARRFERRQRLAALHARREVARQWRRRLADVVASPDNADIPRVDAAGRRDGGEVVMHNGLRVAYGSYGTYDADHTMRVLERNGGVHEPQEEKIFQQVVPLMPPGGVMLELGAFWGFYSLWFARQVPDARCVLVEPVWANLNAGRLNFVLNGLDAVFVRAQVGAAPRRHAFDAPVMSVDALMAAHALPRVHVLHSDIQGAEREMLDGAADAVAAGRIDWMFISTHGNDLHAACRAWLAARGWTIVADADLDDSYSVDGLLVAHRPGLDVPPLAPITFKRATTAIMAPAAAGDISCATT